MPGPKRPLKFSAYFDQGAPQISVFPHHGCIHYNGIFCCDNTLEKETDSSVDLATAGHAGHFMHYYYTMHMRHTCNSWTCHSKTTVKHLYFEGTLFRKLKCSFCAHLILPIWKFIVTFEHVECKFCENLIFSNNLHHFANFPNYIPHKIILQFWRWYWCTL